MTVRRALAFSFVDRYAGFAVNFGTSMVLARLLTPAELGVYSVVMVLSGFVAVFRDLGAGQYMVRHPQLSAEVMRKTFAVQLSMGGLLGAFVALAGAPVAAFYKEPRMLQVCWVLGANFVVTPFLAYPVAWLTREMRFGHLAWTRAIGALGGAVASIGLVLADFGPVSLAWGNLATTTAGLVLLLLAALPALPWRPQWRGVREVLAFGGGLTAVSMISSFRAGLPEMAVGRLLGLTQAGYLSRGQSLCSTFDILVMGAVGPVILPLVSRAHREGRPLGPVVSKALAMLCGVGWPFFALIAVLADPLIYLLFGAQWAEAVGPARWLALSAAAWLPLSVVSSALVAAGRVRALLYMHGAAAMAAAIGLALGIGGGLAAATASMATLAVCNMVICLALLRRSLGLKAGDTVRPLRQALALAMAACAAALLVRSQLPMAGITSALLLCAASGVGALVCLSVAARIMRHALWDEVHRRGQG